MVSVLTAVTFQSWSPVGMLGNDEWHSCKSKSVVEGGTYVNDEARLDCVETANALCIQQRLW